MSSLFSWVYKSYKSKSWLIFIINDANITNFSKLRKNTFKLRYIPTVWKIFNKKLVVSFISLIISTLIWFWFLIRGRFGILLWNRRRHNMHRNHTLLIKYKRLRLSRNGMVNGERAGSCMWLTHRLTCIWDFFIFHWIFRLFFIALLFFYFFVLVIL